MLSVLTDIQEQVYGHRFSCYRQSGGAVDGDKKEADGEWALIFADEPCLFTYTQNDSDAAIVARFKRRSALTEDTLTCWIGLDVRDGDMLLDVTPGSANAAAWSRVQGQPRKIPSYDVFELNYLRVKLMTDEQPDDELRGLVD